MESNIKASELKQYHGNCHCRNFKFSITVPEIKTARTCNCSICSKNGYVWLFPIADKDFMVEKGENSLREYRFGRMAITHQFCPKCGTSVLARRSDNAPAGETLRINIRALRDVELDGLAIEKINGAEVEPQYHQPVKTSSRDDVDNETGNDDLREYDGNCHCGAVSYTVKTKPLTKAKVMSCNCSLCSRNGDLWIYPSKSAVDLCGEDKLTDYKFLSDTSLHAFCSVCGVSVVVHVTEPGEDIMPLNVRTISGIDLDGLTLNRYDGRKNDPQYEV